MFPAARFIVLGLAALLAACDGPPPPSTAIGDPLPGLDSTQLARFESGRALFEHVYLPGEGLGPLFNENQCSACHTDPAAGGTGEQFLLKATRTTPDGRCDLLSGEGGENVRRRATPALQAHGIERQEVPPSATATGRFNVPFLFGLGLVEAIPDDEILAHADADDANRDGISGRAGRDAAGHLARFGRKAETATLEDFIDTALRFEMGLTTPLHPEEHLPDGSPYPPDTDPVPEPEIDSTRFELFADFVRFLAPAPRGQPATPEDRATVERGAALFDRLGCAACHVASMRTGRNAVDALDRKDVPLHSDLLLHDLGPALGDVCGIVATPTELRTAMLMGLRYRKVFLHDGRAGNLFDAIRAHGGEATAARARFESLDRVTQEDLIRYLRTL